MEALNRVIRSKNTRRTSGIAARFRQRAGLAPVLPLPLFDANDNLTDAHDNLTDDDNEDVESDNNNQSGGAELPVDNPVNGSTVRTHHR